MGNEAEFVISDHSAIIHTILIKKADDKVYMLL